MSVFINNKFTYALRVGKQLAAVTVKCCFMRPFCFQMSLFINNKFTYALRVGKQLAAVTVKCWFLRP